LDRLEKQARGAPRGQAGSGAEREALRKIKDHLECELPVRSMSLTDDEQAAVRHLEFLTQKPVVIVPNTHEANLGTAPIPALADLEEWAARSDSPVVPICGAVELEVAQLGPEEEAEYLGVLGIETAGRDRLIRTVYGLLGLISFFTVGEDEVKAWTIRRGDNAVTAAGKIHSDLARGFIRAEVIPCAALLEAGGPKPAREQGLFRLEQKPYVVRDGDILNIRFSV
jgi:ribosome-binding ATPase YchF (GTP1/OBG family)